jgi:hypothetical protein
MSIRQPTNQELAAKNLTRAQYDTLGLTPWTFFGNDPVVLEQYGWPYGIGITNYEDALSEDDQFALLEQRGGTAIRKLKQRQDNIIEEAEQFRQQVIAQNTQNQDKFDQAQQLIISLRNRITILENQVAELNSRVAALE